MRVVRARVCREGARLAWRDSKKTLTKAKHTKESVCAARTPLGSSRPHPQPLSRVADPAAEEDAASALALQLRVDLETKATMKSKLNTCGQGVAARGVKVGGGSFGAVCRDADAAHKCGHGGQLWLQGWCRAVGVGCMHAWLA